MITDIRFDNLCTILLPHSIDNRCITGVSQLYNTCFTGLEACYTAFMPLQKPIEGFTPVKAYLKHSQIIYFKPQKTIMAKLKSGILGAISGAIGPVVGGEWMGIAYLRKLPKKRKKGSRTVAELANEQKFKFGNNWMVPLHPFLAVGFQNLAIRKTAIAAAFSANYKQVITGTYPDLIVDYSKVVISKGDLPVLKQPVITLTAADTITLSWEPDAGRKAVYNDQLLLVVYCPELGTADGFVGAALRRDLHCDFKFNPEMAGKVLQVYVGMTSMDRKSIADSIYLGQINPSL